MQPWLILFKSSQTYRAELKIPVKTKTDAMLEEPYHESFSEKTDTELDRDEVCYERFGMVEITEISEGEEEVPEEPPKHGNKSGGTRTAAENSTALFLLLYDYEKVEKKDPMKDVDQASFSNHLPNKPDDGVVAVSEEEVGQENLKKLPLAAKKSCANYAAMGIEYTEPEAEELSKNLSGIDASIVQISTTSTLKITADMKQAVVMVVEKPKGLQLTAKKLLHYKRDTDTEMSIWRKGKERHGSLKTYDIESSKEREMPTHQEEVQHVTWTSWGTCPSCSARPTRGTCSS